MPENEKKKKAKRRLLSAKISFISLCPRGANGMETILKDDDGDNFNVNTVITKYNEIEGLLHAVVYAPEVVDSQGDIASAEVVKQMAHDFLRNGGKLDIRHDNKPVPPEQAAIVESFLIQKGDPRFADVRTYDGKKLDVTGAWGIVVKIDDEERKAAYAKGEWRGVSMGGVGNMASEDAAKKEQDDMAITEEQANKLIAKQDETNTALKALVEALKPSAPAKVEKADEKKTPVFKGSRTNHGDLRRFAAEVRAFNIEKGVDWNDPASVMEYAERLEELAKQAEAHETPDQRAERLFKETTDLKAQLKQLKGLPASRQGVAKQDSVLDGVEGGLSKADEDSLLAAALEGIGQEAPKK